MFPIITSLQLVQKLNERFQLLTEELNMEDYPSNSSFSLSPTLPGETGKLIASSDIKKSIGPNSIPAYILQILKPFCHSGYHS